MSCWKDGSLDAQLIKTCTKCGVQKCLDEFPFDKRGRGYVRNQCRKCSAAASQAWDRNNPERYRARQNRHKRRTPLDAKYARMAVQVAIYWGWMRRPEYCSQCSSTTGIQAHHVDYTKPLDIVWLCTTCHGKERRHERVLRA